MRFTEATRNRCMKVFKALGRSDVCGADGFAGEESAPPLELIAHECQKKKLRSDVAPRVSTKQGCVSLKRLLLVNDV